MTLTNKRGIDMLHGRIAPAILLFTLPIAASSIMQQLFNSADTAIAGKFGTPDALAAVGTNGEIVALIVGLSAGLAVGANVLIAHYIGAQEHKRIPAAVHTSMLLSVIIGLIFAVGGQFAAGPLLRLINTPEDILRSAESYLRIYLAGSPFLMIYDFGAAVLRAKGDSRRPLIALMLSGVINVLLNLFFVIGLKLSVVGVALATDISTALSAGAVVFWLMREQDEFRLHPQKLALDAHDLKRILIIGIPAAIQDAVFCVANIFIQSAINTFGSSAAAGSAISMNLEYVAYYINTAFRQAATTFTSQNYAAGNIKRCRRIFRVCFALAMGFALFMCEGFVLLREPLSGVFSSVPEEIAYSCERMLVILSFQPLCTLYEVPAWTMRGLGRSTLPAMEMMFGICGVRIVWLFTVFRHFGTLKSLYAALPTTWVITSVLVGGTFAVIWRRTLSKKRADTSEQICETTTAGA